MVELRVGPELDVALAVVLGYRVSEDGQTVWIDGHPYIIGHVDVFGGWSPSQSNSLAIESAIVVQESHKGIAFDTGNTEWSHDWYARFHSAVGAVGYDSGKTCAEAIGRAIISLSRIEKIKARATVRVPHYAKTISRAILALAEGEQVKG